MALIKNSVTKCFIHKIIVSHNINIKHYINTTNNTNNNNKTKLTQNKT